MIALAGYRAERDWARQPDTGRMLGEKGRGRAVAGDTSQSPGETRYARGQVKS